MRVELCLAKRVTEAKNSRVRLSVGISGGYFLELNRTNRHLCSVENSATWSPVGDTEWRAEDKMESVLSGPVVHSPLVLCMSQIIHSSWSLLGRGL